MKITGFKALNQTVKLPYRKNKCPVISGSMKVKLLPVSLNLCRIFRLYFNDRTTLMNLKEGTISSFNEVPIVLKMTNILKKIDNKLFHGCINENLMQHIPVGPSVYRSLH